MGLLVKGVIHIKTSNSCAETQIFSHVKQTIGAYPYLTVAVLTVRGRLYLNCVIELFPIPQKPNFLICDYKQDHFLKTFQKLFFQSIGKRET